MKKQFCLIALLCMAATIVFAQTTIKGKVIDVTTNQPLTGVTVSGIKNATNSITDKNGNFSISESDTLLVSFTGYNTQQLIASAPYLIISLTPTFANLDEVIVSGNREAQRRTEVPASISVISKTLINDTKATMLNMLINKVPGVFMVDLGNEQHSMAVRQPIGTKNLYLYLEDGIPIRTVGDFNHNALIEINQASAERIEVIKGPASSLYGSEAVGGAINFLTQSPSTIFTGKVQAEAGSRGYKRTDFNVSNTFKKLGIYFGGYYANQSQPVEEHNDFTKTALTLRADYAFNNTTKLVTVADYINYKTDQKGGLDSAHFFNEDYISFYRFTYRKVDAFRLRSTLTKEWNTNNRTTFTVFYRNTSIGQNPFYSIGNIAGTTSRAKGQINEDAFKSYGTVVQHTKKIVTLHGKWITGISADVSPANYIASYIDIDKDPRGVFYNYTSRDSLLTRYDVDLLNTAVYTQVEFNPVYRLKVVAAARYDRLDYKFDNHLPPSAFTGAPDAIDHFARFTPKVGFTYNFGHNKGLYVNYSVGFAPPNITDLYTGVKVPVLKPSSYNNYEAGGWIGFAKNKGYAEVTLYKLKGTNEIVSVRLPDATFANQNAGSTTHHGIEINIKYAPVDDLMFRIGGTVAGHTYDEYVHQGKSFSGNRMPQAPPYIINGEITFKPSCLKGFRVAIEYQGLGGYYTNPENTARYQGFNMFNARMGYSHKAYEIWLNCINVTDKIYATSVEKTAFGTFYRPGQLRSINIGLGYNFRHHQ